MSDKKEKPGFLERAEEKVDALLHPQEPAEKPKAAAKAEAAPPPHHKKHTVHINAVELSSDGQTEVVWAEVAGKEYGVPFHKPDLDKLTDIEAKRQYIARQVLVAAAAGKDEITTPPEDRPLLGVVHVEE